MNKIWKAISANYSLKLYALVLALLIWFYVVLQNEYQINLVVPIDFQLENDSAFVAEPISNKAILNVKGKGGAILRLKFWGRLSINYTLESNRGWTRVNIGQNDISFPPWSDVSLLSIETKPFLVRIDKIIEENLPVVPIVEPTVKNIKVVPDSVRCKGGMEVFKEVKYIRTEPVAVDTTKLPSRKRANLDIPPDITCDHTHIMLYLGLDKED